MVDMSNDGLAEFTWGVGNKPGQFGEVELGRLVANPRGDFPRKGPQLGHIAFRGFREGFPRLSEFFHRSVDQGSELCLRFVVQRLHETLLNGVDHRLASLESGFVIPFLSEVMRDFDPMLHPHQHLVFIEA